MATTMFMRRLWPSEANDLDPGRLLRDFERLLDTVTQSPWSSRRDPSAGVFPLVNVSRDPEKFYVRAELPGVSVDELDITAEGNKLSISGERKIAAEAGVSYHRRERAAGAFSRTITLPAPFDNEHVEARYQDGVLTVTLPVAEAMKARRINIRHD